MSILNLRGEPPQNVSVRWCCCPCRHRIPIAMLYSVSSGHSHGTWSFGVSSNLTWYIHSQMPTSLSTLFPPFTVCHDNYDILTSLRMSHHFFHASRIHPSGEFAPSPGFCQDIESCNSREGSQVNELFHFQFYVASPFIKYCQNPVPYLSSLAPGYMLARPCCSYGSRFLSSLIRLSTSIARLCCR